MKALRVIRYEPTMNGHLTISPTGSLVSYDEYKAVLASKRELFKALDDLLAHTPMVGDCHALLRYGKAQLALRNTGAEAGGGK